MKVALVGATGFIGSRILAELTGRNHSATAIVRHPERVPAHAKIVAKQGDVYDRDGLAKLLAGHDAVVTAVHYTASDPALLLDAVRQSGVKRYLVVGGAGSLEVAPGVRLVDTPNFPAAYKTEAQKGGDYLTLLRGETHLDWTFLSPSALIQPGERRGKFRLGGDQLLTDEKGDSKISAEDYAIALVDELETPRHVRERFTVGY